MLTYAIGDVHGCADLLRELVFQIERHAGGQPHRVVCVGDYIDRGPDSAGAIAFLRNLQARAKGPVLCLRGNHEDLLLKALTGGPDEEGLWLLNGGDTTLASYGAARAGDLPEEVLRWVATCPTAFEDERRCFVHAGLHPARRRDEQHDHDRLWIRDPFLERDHDFGRFVVHGHTPRRDGRPDIRPFRVNLDTAAVFGGPLTAGIFTDDQAGPIGFLQARR